MNIYIHIFKIAMSSLWYCRQRRHASDFRSVKEQSSVKFSCNYGQSACEEQFKKTFKLLGAWQCMHNMSDTRCYKQWGRELACSVPDWFWNVSRAIRKGNHIEIHKQINKIAAVIRNFIINDQKRENKFFSYARKSGLFEISRFPTSN